MKNINNILSRLESYRILKSDIESGNTPVLASGVINAQETHVIDAICEDLKRPALIIAENDLKAAEIYENMRFLNKNTILFPSRDIIFYSADVHSKETDTKRVQALKRLAEGEILNVVVSAEAEFDWLIPAEFLRKSVSRIVAMSFCEPRS